MSKDRFISNGSEYTVNGMHCSHSVSSVVEEVGEVVGIDEVDVDLSTGSLTLTSTKPVDPAILRAAVEKVGCKLVAQ